MVSSLAVGRGGGGLLKPSTFNSVILAQLFSVFPLTVTLTKRVVELVVK